MLELDVVLIDIVAIRCMLVLEIVQEKLVGKLINNHVFWKLN